MILDLIVKLQTSDVHTHQSHNKSIYTIYTLLYAKQSMRLVEDLKFFNHCILIGCLQLSI